MVSPLRRFLASDEGQRVDTAAGMTMGVIGYENEVVDATHDVTFTSSLGAEHPWSDARSDVPIR